MTNPVLNFCSVRDTDACGSEVTDTAEKGSKIEELARAAVMPVVERYGLKLWDVCFEKEGAMWYLRVLVDKDGGLDSDECDPDR